MIGPEEREFLIATSGLGTALDALEAALRGERIPEETVLELRLVAEEVLTNLAKYGHAEGGEHLARVRLALASGTVVLEFTDDGRPFDPLAAPAPDLELPVAERPIGGLGIHLILSLVDAAAYARVGSSNVLTVRKRIRPTAK